MHAREKFWPQTKRVWRRFDQMDRVMGRLGADALTAARQSRGAALAQARNVCRRCRAYEKCLLWLVDDGDAAALERFCRNAGFFKACGRGATLRWAGDLRPAP